MYGILFQHPHGPIHTYPPAASKLTRRHQRKEAAISSRFDDGDDGDKPKSGELAVLCCPPERAGRSGPLGNAPNGSSRAKGPERLASLEQTQPYHEVCGMGAWRAWSLLLNLDHKLSCRGHLTHCHLPILYVYTSIRLPFLPSTIGRQGRGHEQDFAQARGPLVSRGIRWSRRARAGEDKPTPSPCTRQFTPTPRLSLSVHVALEGGPNERCRASGLS